MGRVWRATDVVLHREVAIKELVPPPGLTPGERQEMRERSLREARAIARLNNVNVVRVFDVLRTDADPWIVMEYVPSRSLQDTLAADGPFSPGRTAEIGLGVLNALRAAHRAGVVHRDVKPGNVLMGADGRVVLTDFGLATVPGDPNVTRTGLVLGSPAYIAPERARDGSAGPGADLWSLGATLYAAVEGASPFARPSAIATLAALATENPPPARNAGPLKPVLNGLLRKDPAHRINAEEAERLLLRAAGRRSKLSFPMSPTMRRPGVGRDRSALTGGTASTPVVPGPRPPVARPGGTTPGRSPVTPGRSPVTPGRPTSPPGPPPVTPSRPAAGEGRPPIFTPGKASVGRPVADTPTRVDPPKGDPPQGDKPLDATRVDSPKVEATRVDGPPVRDDKTAIFGTRSGTPTTPGQPSGLSRTSRGAQSSFTAGDVAAGRRKQAAPEHEKSLADATSLISRAASEAKPVPADPTTKITEPAKQVPAGPSDVQPSDVQPSATQPSAAESSETKPSDIKPSAPEPVDAEPVDAELSEAELSEAEQRPTESAPAEEEDDAEQTPAEPEPEVQAVAEEPEPATKAADASPAPVDQTTKISEPADRTTKIAESADRTTMIAEPARKAAIPDATQVVGSPRGAKSTSAAGGSRAAAEKPRQTESKKTESKKAARGPESDHADDALPAGPFNRPSRPAWTPMPVSQTPGITVFGTRLTYGQAAIGGGVVLLIVVLIAVLIGRGSGDDNDPAGQNAAAPPASSGGDSPKPSGAGTSAAPTSAAPSSPSALALPSTWRIYTDGSGYKIPLPKSAEIEQQGSETHIRWNNRLLLIDQTADPQGDALADWKDQERSRAGRDYQNYQKVRLESVPKYFKQAADWEFFYNTTSGNRQHAVKRNIVVSDDLAYSISWYVSPEDWIASQNDLKLLYQGFQPK